MKTLKLLILLLIVGTYNLKAQHDYKPMAVENAQWVYYNSDDDDLPPWIDYYFGYKIQGDIEINSKWYKKVYYRRFTPVTNDGGPSYPPVYISTEVLFGAIRDDIVNRKVYGIVFSGNGGYGGCGIFDEEFLMYDFDMNVGDTFEYFCLVGGGSISLSNITVVDLFDENRLLYQLVDGYPCCESGYQLEGIGNYFPYDGAGYFGLFNPMGVPAGCPCTSFIRYCIGTDEECLDGFLLANSEYNLQNEISIFPNPVKNVLTINNNSISEIQFVEIYNVLGKLLCSDRIEYQNINTTHLTNGIYMVKVVTSKGTILKKIIKK